MDSSFLFLNFYCNKSDHFMATFLFLCNLNIHNMKLFGGPGGGELTTCNKRITRGVHVWGHTAGYFNAGDGGFSSSGV